MMSLWSVLRLPTFCEMFEAVSPEVWNADQNHSDPMLYGIQPISQKMKLDDIFSSLQSLNLAGYIQDKEREPLLGAGLPTVYRARSTKHNKTVVLKRTRANFLGGISFAEVYSSQPCT